MKIETIKILQGQFPGGRPHPAVMTNNFTSGFDVQAKENKYSNTHIQKYSSGNAFKIDPSRINLSGSGTPLPQEVAQKMEAVFNTNFSDVRIHTGGYQAESIGALAFTTGHDIYFATGHYNPNSSHGQRLLGHELTHVVQQRNGRVRNPFGGGVAVVNDYGLEAEAERMGLQSVMRPIKVQPQKCNHDCKRCSHNHSGAVQRKSNGIIQRDSPCFIPDWLHPPYEGLWAWENTNYHVGPNAGFAEALKDKIYQENRKIHNPGNYIKITVPNSNQVVKSDGDGSLLITKRDLTFAIANIDHVVEKAKGGCNSCLNAQVLAESANVGAVYTGGKWIYDPASGKRYTDNHSNRVKFGLTGYP